MTLIRRGYYLGALLFFGTGLALAGDARDIMHQVHERDTGDDSESRMILTYTQPSGSEQVIELDVWNKDYGDESKTLMLYVAPQFMRGSGLLAHEFSDSEDHQWLHLSRSASREPRRIPTSQKGERLFGTDFYYIDIEDKVTDDYSYSLIAEEAINGLSYTVIEAVPDDSDYPYDRTISWVDKDRDLEKQVEFYDNGELHKTLEVKKFKQINGIWTPVRSMMTNHSDGSSTEMFLETIQYNVGVSDDKFTFEALTKGR